MTFGLAETIRGATLIGLDNSVRALFYSIRRARLDAQERWRRGAQDPRPSEHGPGTPRYADEIDGGLRLRFDRAVLQVRFLASGGVFVGWSAGQSDPEDRAAPESQSAPEDQSDPEGRAGSAGHAVRDDDRTDQPPDGGAAAAAGPSSPTAASAQGVPGDGKGLPRPGEPPSPEPSYAVAGEVHWASGVTVEQGDDGWLLSRGPLGVRVGSDGALTFFDGDRTMRTDDPPSWRGREWCSRSRLPTGAGVFGLGGRSARPNLRGTFRLWNTEPGGSWTEGTDPLSITMPTYVAVSDVGSALAFYDNTFDGEVEVDDRAVALRVTDGPLRYYVFCGSLPGVFEDYTALTGKPALPPRWAFGYHHAKWGFHTESAVRTMVAEFRRRDLPLSGVWLDIDHMRDKAVFSVDTNRFPDLEGLSERLAAGNTRLVVIVDPAVPYRSGNQVYESGMARGVFCRDVNGNVARGVVWPGDVAYPDFTSPRAREWWGENYRFYTDLGVSGFWHDMNEPSAFVAFGDPTLPLSTRHELDGRGGDHREAHNIYGLQMNRAAYESLGELSPDQRPFLISRSGWAGMQRFGGTWTGDVSTGWESLRASLWFTLGLAMSGVPYSGPDIGGFDGHPDPELFARWFQLAGYLPFFRTHSSFRQPSREPWSWPERIQAVLRVAMVERYELLPYWYSLAHRASRTGVPYVRPLCWADPGDPALRKVDDAFLLGQGVLVAPVLTAGTSERSVRLPAGRWYDRRDGTVYEGPGQVTVAAELSAGVPVLVRAGSVLPVFDGDQVILEAYHRDESPGDAGAISGSEETWSGPGGELFTDDGDGWDEPIVERFSVQGDRVAYEGPADAQPYPVRWVPSPK